MKTYILLLITLFPLIAQSQKSSNTADESDNKNAVPTGHAIYRMINDPGRYSLADMDSFYRNEILKEEKAPYSTELRNMGFSLLVNKGLEEADDELKAYYINEQIKSEENISSVSEFYKLLLSCRTFMPKEELVKNATAFYDKNRAAISNKPWPEPADRNARLLALMKEHKVFNRYIAVAMKE